MKVIKQQLLIGEEVVLLPNIEKIDGEYIYNREKNVNETLYFWADKIKKYMTIGDDKIRSIVLNDRQLRELIRPVKKYHCYIYHDNEIKVLEFSRTLRNIITNYNQELIKKALSETAPGGKGKVNLIWNPPFDKSLKINAKNAQHGMFKDYSSSEVVDIDPIIFGNTQDEVQEFLSDKDLKLEDIPKKFEVSKNEKAYSYLINLPQLVEAKKKMRNEKIDKLI